MGREVWEGKRRGIPGYMQKGDGWGVGEQCREFRWGGLGEGDGHKTRRGRRR